MKMEECRHGNQAPQDMLLTLPESQGGLGRHKCPNCAYQFGIAEVDQKIAAQGKIIPCAHGNYAPEGLLIQLGESQGGSGRHKCVICAYQAGRANARGLAHEDAWVPRQKEQKGSIEKIATPTAKLATRDPDWWKQEAERRKEIGDLGEALVLEYEKSYLISMNRPDLANRVTHVSKDEGDHMGYDVRSYGADGVVKYIEVKTTTRGIESPFYMTENERMFSVAHVGTYCVYRLFGLDEALEKASFYIIDGDIMEKLELQPISYQVMLKGIQATIE